MTTAIINLFTKAIFLHDKLSNVYRIDWLNYNRNEWKAELKNPDIFDQE